MKKLFYLPILMVYGCILSAQTNIVRVDFTARKPFPIYFEAYTQGFENVTISFTNISQNEAPEFVVFASLVGPHGISGLSNESWCTRGLNVGSTHVFAYANYDDLCIEFPIYNLNLGGLPDEVSSDLFLRHIMPEGNYQFCIILKNYSTGEEIGKGCLDFEIIHPDRPKIIQPFDNDFLDGATRVIYPVSWMHNITDPKIRMSTTYRLVVKDLGSKSTDDEDNPIVSSYVATYDAMLSSEYPMAFTEDQIMGTSFNLPIPDMQMIDGHYYGLMVIAENDEFPFSTDAARSDVVRFEYEGPFEAECGENVAVSPSFPARLETVPLTRFPLIGMFEPYCDQYRNYDFHAVLKHMATDNVVSDFDRSIPWNSGPRKYLQYIFNKNDIDFNDDDGYYSSHIAHQDVSALPTLERGENYVWSSTGEMKFARGRRTLSFGANIQPSVFTVGMPIPKLQSPLGGDSLEAGPVHFDVSFEQIPSAPIPPIKIIQIVDNQIIPYQISPVNEVAVIQVSNNVSFDTMIFVSKHAINYDLDANGSPNDKEYDLNAFNLDVYADYSFDNAFEKPGTYYWRVAWVKHPEMITPEKDLLTLENTDFYHQSPIDSFVIADTVKISDSPVATTPIENNGCGDQALYTENISTQAALSGIQRDEEISVGKFVMEITEVTNQNGQYSGKGRIKIPFLKDIYVKTVFNNIRINQNKRVFEGNIITEQGGNELESISNYILNQPMQTPIGWDTTIGGQTFTLAIKEITFEPTVATMKTELNWSDVLPAALEGPQWPVFGNEISIHPGGFGKSVLFFPHEDVIFDENQEGYGLRFKGGTGEQDSASMCYVQWGCRGFEGYQIAGQVNFDEDVLRKDSGINDNDEVIPGRVTANFIYRHTASSNNSGFIIRANMDPFQIDGVNGWGFKTDTVYIDYSDLENPPGFNVPAGFQYSGMNDPNTVNTFQGVYIPRINCYTPKGWGYSDKRTGIMGASLIYCSRANYMLTLRATDVLTTGVIARMEATIDTIELKHYPGETSGKINGKLTLPMCESDSYLKYSGFYSGNNDWSMAVRMGNDSLTIPALVAKVVLNDNSTILLNKHPDSTTWRVNMELHGYMTVNSDYQPSRLTSALSGIDFKRMEFQGMGYETGVGFKNKPVFRPASPEKSLNGFPVQLDSIDFLVSNGNPALYFKPKINLVGDVNGFSVAAGLIIEGKMDFSGDKDFLTAGDLTLSDAELNVRTSGFELIGRLRFINTEADKGMEGVLAAKFPSNIAASVRAKFGTYKASSNAVFNTSNYYSYWFADALVTFGSNGIPLFAGVNMYGIGGGLWYNMRQDTVTKVQYSKLIGQQNQNATDPQNSGIPYSRYFSSSFGFKVQGLFGSPSGGSTYNMMLAVGAQFNSHGGPNVFLKGDAYFMSKITDRKADNTVDVTNRSFWGKGEFNYNGQEHFIDGRIEAFAQIRVNDKNLIYGLGPGYRVAEAKFHAKTSGENFWYFKLGEPEQKAGIKLDIGKALTIQAYLMIGMGLPATLPSPDQDFLNMIRNVNSSYTSSAGSYESIMNRQVQVNGNGFAVGVILKDSIDKKFTPFYFKALAVVGADINITNSPDRVCAETNHHPGFNNWYAQGQMYAGLKGEFGIHVDVLIFEGDKSLFSGSIATIMTGGLPNPSWFECKGRMSYNVLGIVEGSHSFQFNIGERCTIGSGNPFAASPLITDMIPVDESTNVSVFTTPEAAFSLPMNRTLEFFDDKLNKLRKFKAIIKSKTLAPSGHHNISMEEFWAEDAYTARFPTARNLYGETWTTFTLVAGGKEIIGAEEVDIMENGSVWTETKYVRFKTGIKPDTLSPEQVSLTYPIEGQNYFMKGETDAGSGFVALLKEDPDLFFTTKSVNGNTLHYKYEMNFISLGSNDTISSVVNIENFQVLRFDVQNLEPSKKYIARLYRRVDASANLASGITANMYAVMSNAASTSSPRVTQAPLRVNVADKYDYTIIPARFISLGRPQIQTGEKMLYQFVFGTSKHATLAEKLAGGTIIASRNTDQNLYISVTGISEGLDVVEVTGYKRRTDNNIFTDEKGLIRKGSKRFTSSDDVNISPFENWEYDNLWLSINEKYYYVPKQFNASWHLNLKDFISDKDLYLWSEGNSLRPLMSYASLFPSNIGGRGNMVGSFAVVPSSTMTQTVSLGSSVPGGPGFTLVLPYGTHGNNHLVWNKTRIQQKMNSSIPVPGPKPGIVNLSSFSSILQDINPLLYQRVNTYLGISSFQLSGCVNTYMGFSYEVPWPLHGGRTNGTTSKIPYQNPGINCK